MNLTKDQISIFLGINIQDAKYNIPPKPQHTNSNNHNIRIIL